MTNEALVECAWEFIERDMDFCRSMKLPTPRCLDKLASLTQEISSYPPTDEATTAITHRFCFYLATCGEEFDKVLEKHTGWVKRRYRPMQNVRAGSAVGKSG